VPDGGQSERAEFLPTGLPGVHLLRVRASLRPYSMHHTTYAFTRVLAGHGRWHYRRWQPDVGPRRTMLIEPGELHVTTKVHTPASFDALFVESNEVRRLLERNGLGPQLHFSAPDVGDPAVAATLGRVVRAIQRRQSVEVRELCLDEAILALAERSESRAKAALPRYFQPLLEALRAEIDARLDDHWSGDGGGGARVISVRRMAAERGLAPVALIRSFRAAFGTTPFHYAQMRKMGRALQLIQRGPRGGIHTLTDIATAAGFYDGAQFSRMFRAQLGVTPSTFASTAHRGWGPRPSQTT